jgi:hypothetical protein
MPIRLPQSAPVTSGEVDTMQFHITDHLVGNIIIIAAAGIITVACFAAAIRMLVRPGEKNKRHPKYEVLNDDR